MFHGLVHNKNQIIVKHKTYQISPIIQYCNAKYCMWINLLKKEDLEFQKSITINSLLNLKTGIWDCQIFWRIFFKKQQNKDKKSGNCFNLNLAGTFSPLKPGLMFPLLNPKNWEVKSFSFSIIIPEIQIQDNSIFQVPLV